jgi:hypothetical protein
MGELPHGQMMIPGRAFVDDRSETMCTNARDYRSLPASQATSPAAFGRAEKVANLPHPHASQPPLRRMFGTSLCHDTQGVDAGKPPVLTFRQIQKIRVVTPLSPHPAAHKLPPTFVG